jgi:hypothetical protein
LTIQNDKEKTSMGEVTYEHVDLMLRLYEIRREARLRQARDWFAANFRATTEEEVRKLCPPGSENNTSLRMVISYWDMVAGIVNRGLIDKEFFFENSGELWMVWEFVRPIIPVWRAAFKDPQVFGNLEQVAKDMEAWREERAPGSIEAMRQMMAQMNQAAQAAQEPPKAKTAGN